jgi:hypothetical protein
MKNIVFNDDTIALSNYFWNSIGSCSNLKRLQIDGFSCIQNHLVENEMKRHIKNCLKALEIHHFSCSADLIHLFQHDGAQFIHSVFQKNENFRSLSIHECGTLNTVNFDATALNIFADNVVRSLISRLRAIKFDFKSDDPYSRDTTNILHICRTLPIYGTLVASHSFEQFARTTYRSKTDLRDAVQRELSRGCLSLFKVLRDNARNTNECMKLHDWLNYWLKLSKETSRIVRVEFRFDGQHRADKAAEGAIEALKKMRDFADLQIDRCGEINSHRFHPKYVRKFLLIPFEISVNSKHGEHFILSHF